jgi:hypothetical protein
MHIDATTGFLYWWNKPDGKVLGAISLADTLLTQLPAPEFCFRLSRQGRFRDFRADSAASLATWVKHLSDEIAARTSGTAAPVGAAGLSGPLPTVTRGGVGAASTGTISAASTSGGRPALVKSGSSRDVNELRGEGGATSAVGGGAGENETSPAKEEERTQSLEAELLVLKQRVRELEERNAKLEGGGNAAANGGSGGGGDEEEDAKAAALLKTMNLESDQSLRDQLEDMRFQHKSAQKRLKVANETIKKQAQRIALLEGGKPPQ